MPRYARVCLMIGVVCLCMASRHNDGTRGGDVSSAGLAGRYGSLPKGMILEGSAQGMERVRRLSYSRSEHALILNGATRYRFPLPPADCASILRSIAKDDRLGVSIVLGERRIVYGTLDAEHPVMRSLFASDIMLVSLVFGWRNNLEGVALPNGFQPDRSMGRTARTVCTSRMDSYVFAKSGNSYVRSDCRLELILTPMSSRRAPDGGYLPDESALARNEFDRADLANRSEVERRTDEYLALYPLNRTSEIGEVAAVARHLRDCGANLDYLASRIELSTASAPAVPADALALEKRLTDFSRTSPDPDDPVGRTDGSLAGRGGPDPLARAFAEGGRSVGRALSGCVRVFGFGKKQDRPSSAAPASAVQPSSGATAFAGDVNSPLESGK